MNSEHEEYALGEDVTELAASKVRKGTAILSVRVSSDELTEIEAVGRVTGKSVSRLVREAISGYLRANSQGAVAVTISIQGGSTLSTGPTGIQGRAAQSQTIPDPANLAAVR